MAAAVPVKRLGQMWSCTQLIVVSMLHSVLLQLLLIPLLPFLLWHLSLQVAFHPLEAAAFRASAACSLDNGELLKVQARVGSDTCLPCHLS